MWGCRSGIIRRAARGACTGGARCRCALGILAWFRSSWWPSRAAAWCRIAAPLPGDPPVLPVPAPGAVRSAANASGTSGSAFHLCAKTSAIAAASSRARTIRMCWLAPHRPNSDRSTTMAWAANPRENPLRASPSALRRRHPPRQRLHQRRRRRQLRRKIFRRWGQRLRCGAIAMADRFRTTTRLIGVRRLVNLEGRQSAIIARLAESHGRAVERLTARRPWP